MKYLVTGGNGFIGSHIVERLAANGDEVIVFDNYSLGIPRKTEGNVKHIAGDIADRSYLSHLCRGGNFDAIIHQAAASSTPMFRANWHDSYLTNVAGFANILEAARCSSIEKVVYATTSNVYNGLPSCPVYEHNHVSSQHFEPLHEGRKIESENLEFYELTKYMNEITADKFSRTYGIKTVGLRYFSIYGKNEKQKGKYANLVSQFIWDLLEDKTISIYGKGDALRDFVYYEDCVDANLAAVAYDGSGVLNVATGTSITIFDLVQLIGKIMGKTPAIKFEDEPIGYVHGGYASTTNAEIMGFKAKVKLEDGIKQLVEYYGGSK